MPRATKLKVFRTPIGFHDAYVAAPSQKAALAAWGSDVDLFARGSAELVTDADLSREPLASPGKVIRRSRGSLAEQLAALPEAPAAAPLKSREASAPPPPRQRAPKAKPSKPKPKPDRSPVDEAQRALADVSERYDDIRKQLTKRQGELDRERRSLEKAHEEEVAALQRKLEQAEAAYDRALRKWQG